MLNIVLYQPEIQPNTGNIIRLCANVGARLHLVHPLGFTMNEKALRRAGLDYHEWATVQEYRNWADFIDKQHPARFFACTTKASKYHTSVTFLDNDYLVFGPETRGLPADIINSTPEGQRIKIPMHPSSRSLNLSNAVAVIVYEAWRQCDFKVLPA